VAVFRLFRATILFGRIFVSYMLQLGLQKVFGRTRLRERWRRVHRRNARRLYRGILRLRGVYIKLGQILSIMGTFLPRAYQEELEPLQDKVPPHRFDEVQKTFLRSLGKTPHELYASFEEKPLAAASLGQVHRARLAGGEDVAVKVLYPNVATIIKVDLRVMGWAMKVYKWFFPIAALESVVEQLRELLDRETNYLHEGKCMERMAQNFAGDPDILFPKMHWELTTDRILTMTFMPGVKISRREELEAMGIDPYVVARKLVEAFYKQLFFDGFFHADPHPGNFLVQKGENGPKIVMLDFGAATEARKNLIDGMLDILRGTFAKDERLVMKGIETMGFVAPGGDRALLERTVSAYFQKLLSIDIQDFSRIKGADAEKLMDPGVKKEELRDLMKSIAYPEGWFYAERAVVILFGLSSQLAPKLNTVQVGFPYIMKLLADRAAVQSAQCQPSSSEQSSSPPS
jgi:predicted unusual protein kinase regulating ubiquinone biosynthesis (AarF/ABC1/UbiB family)